MRNLKFFWTFILLLLFITGCSEFRYLNLKEHRFHTTPRKIIWIQIAGLSLEHFAMLRFGKLNSLDQISLEKISCLGNIWNYNLYKLRPDPYEGFLSQITGKSNIKNSCEDFNQKPFWKYFSNLGYVTGIFESQMRSENFSLLRGKACSQETPNNFLDDVIYWKMSPNKNINLESFHYLGKENFSTNKVYYDKACQAGICHTSLYSNIRSIYRRFIKDRPFAFFLLRDFSFYEFLKHKDIGGARESLSEVEKVVAFLLDENKKEDFLLLITSTGSINLEFPERGKEWSEFEKEGINVIYKKQALLSPLLVYGVGAENFCGIYEESSILKRMLWRPTRPGLQMFREIGPIQERP